MKQQLPRHRTTEENDNAPTSSAPVDVGTRDVGARDVGTRDVGARDVGTRDVGARDANAMQPQQQSIPNHQTSHRPSTIEQAAPQESTIAESSFNHGRQQRSTTALVLKQQRDASQQCPRCGAVQPTSTSICLTCGNYLPAKAESIRCRRCGTHSSANLVLCPGCGRELHATRARSLSWILPLLLVGLFLLLIQQSTALLSLRWPSEQLASGWNWVVAVGEQLDPQLTIETVSGDSTQTLAVNPSVRDAGGNGEETSGGASLLADLSIFATATADVILSGESVDEPHADAESAGAESAGAEVPALVPVIREDLVETEARTQENGSVEIDEAATSSALQIALPTMTATVPPTVPPTVSPTALPTATATKAPEKTPTANVAVLAPTPRPTPTRFRPTATATSASPTSASPTSTSFIENSTAANEIEAATAGGAAAAVTILQPTATNRLAADTPTAVPATATPTDAVTIYKIQAGDTPLEIANRYNIGVVELLTNNGLTVDDARRLRVGQELVIPRQGQTIQTVATPTVAATVAPAPTKPAPTATIPEPTATAASLIRLDVPQLRSPESGASLSCGGENSLIWLPVDFIREDDYYLLHLGFLNGYNTDGSENIVWVLAQQQPTNATIWRMDEALCSLAPQDFGRQWRWYVEVVAPTASEEQPSEQPVSLPSVIWTFSWN